MTPRGILRSQRTIVVAMASTATALAWLWLVRSSPDGRTSMALLFATHHASSQSFFYSAAMWQTMTVAMMTPTMLPWLCTFASLAADPMRRETWWRALVPARRLAGPCSSWQAWCSWRR